MIIEILEGGKFYKIKCDSCGNERVYSKRHARSGRRKFCSKSCINKNRKHSDEWKKEMSSKLSGQNNPFWGKKHSDLTREKISIKAKEGFEKWSAEQRQRWSSMQSKRQAGENNTFYGKFHDAETRSRMSLARSKLVAEGVVRPVRGLKGSHFSQKSLDEEKYDSFYELLYMKILDSNPAVISWTKKHGITIPYEFSGNRTYIPDFLVLFSDGSTSLEEIKGYESSDKLEAKIEAGRSFAKHLGAEYKIIGKKELEALSTAEFNKSVSQLRRDYKNGRF